MKYMEIETVILKEYTVPDFPGENLRELTVHHKDHNHNNNPADSSNWELLCIYCHTFCFGYDLCC